MRQITITAMAALALLVAACGGSTNQFVSDFNAAQKPLDQVLTEVTAASDPTKPEQYAKQMDKLADGLEVTATRLHAVEPPADAEAEFKAYVAQLDRSARTVREVEQVAATGKLDEGLVDALKGLETQLSAAVTAETALRTAVEG